MADKSFEQQVKKELSELRMKPADSVWPVVEAAIQKERKRRWLIWLFLIAGCAGASFWGYYSFKQDKKELAETPAKIQSLPNEETKATTKEKNTPPVAAEKQPQQTQEPSASPLTNATIADSKHLKTTDVSHVQKIPVKTHPPKEGLTEQKTKTTAAVTTQPNNQVFNEPEKSSGTGKDKAADLDVAKSLTTGKDNPSARNPVVTKTEDPATVITKNEIKTTDTSSQLTPINANTLAPAAPAVINTKKKPWQWSIAVDAGSSGLRNGLDFGLKKDLAASSPTAPPITNNGQSIGVGSEPGVRDAFSFGVQIQAKKQWGKKHAIGFSAGYSLMQTSINVGRKVDSLAFWNNSIGTSYSGFYYTTTDSARYNNKYHFVRLGADLYTPFTLFKKIKFQWQLGLGVNFLIASNGLHYDAVAKKMFSDNSLYAKTQAYMATGIDLSLGKTPFLYIGPHWQYSFTNLTAKPGGNQHLFLSSVKLSFVLPKKKK